MLWEALRWLHLLAMAFFVGGQMVIAAAVVPVERAQESRERIRAIARRFGYGTLVAFVVLAATGIALASEFRRWDDPALQVKLGLIGVVAALIVVHLRLPRSAPIDAAIFAGSLAIVALGVSIGH